MAKAKTKTPCQTTEIRTAFYEVSDGLCGLAWAQKAEPMTKDDIELERLITAVDEAFERVRHHLQCKYLWDNI